VLVGAPCIGALLDGLLRRGGRGRRFRLRGRRGGGGGGGAGAALRHVVLQQDVLGLVRVLVGAPFVGALLDGLLLRERGRRDQHGRRERRDDGAGKPARVDFHSHGRLLFCCNCGGEDPANAQTAIVGAAPPGQRFLVVNGSWCVSLKNVQPVPSVVERHRESGLDPGPIGVSGCVSAAKSLEKCAVQTYRRGRFCASD